MIGYVMLGTSNLNRAAAYDDATLAPNMQALAQFDTIGQHGGGTDEGAPGPREENNAIRYASLRDPDGNTLCAFRAGPDS